MYMSERPRAPNVGRILARQSLIPKISNGEKSHVRGLAFLLLPRGPALLRGVKHVREDNVNSSEMAAQGSGTMQGLPFTAVEKVQVLANVFS